MCIAGVNKMKTVAFCGCEATIEAYVMVMIKICALYVIFLTKETA